MTESALDLTPPTGSPSDEAPADETAKPAKAKKAKKEKAPKEVKVKAPKEPKVKKEPQGKRAALTKLFPEDAKITVLVEANPKKAGSRAAEVFDHYFTSATIGDFFLATKDVKSRKHGDQGHPGGYADLRYDVGSGYIKIG